MTRIFSEFGLSVGWKSSVAAVLSMILINSGQAIGDAPDFAADVMPALTKARCNSGPCHGAPSGKNGFRLSLQGYSPEQDFLALTRENFGRRINRADPSQSLLLKKGAGQLPHEGGKRLAPDDGAYQTILGWIVAGCPEARTAPRLVGLTVKPARATVADSRAIPLRVVASFQDGSQVDVTVKAAYSTADEKAVMIDVNGSASMPRDGDAVVMCRYRHLVATARLQRSTPQASFRWPRPQAWNDIDMWTLRNLERRQLLPAPVCDDATFLRRLWLDVAGRLPPLEVVLQFLRDSGPEKRRRAVDVVLERPEFASFWALKWGDILRNRRQKSGERGVRLLQQFLVEACRDNLPLDQMATRLLLAQGDADSVPEANFYRLCGDAQDCGEATAQLWLGVRIQCAKCHNHPFEGWTQDDYIGLAAFFAPLSRKATIAGGETIFAAADFKPLSHPHTGKTVAPKLLGELPSTAASLPMAANFDERRKLARWIVDPRNRLFARSGANRIWFHLFGRGIVDPPDDFRDSNPPANDELLDGLEAWFVQNHYDVKALIRFIALSRTYQLSAEQNPTNQHDQRHFARAYPRPLPAEVLLDAIADVTEVRDRFPDMPAGARAIELPDGEVEHAFLKSFGQPNRESTCECGRGSDPTLAQALQLMNGPEVHAKIANRQNIIGRLLGANARSEDVADVLYLTCLARWPTVAERQRILRHLHATGNDRRALEDLLWTLLNNNEFLLRH